MKNCYVYVVADKVGKSLIQQFFAVSDEDARRKLSMAFEKDQIPSVMMEDIILYKCSPVSFPESYADMEEGEQLELDFVSENEKMKLVVKDRPTSIVRDGKVISKVSGRFMDIPLDGKGK